jgi:hypothetical protein
MQLPVRFQYSALPATTEDTRSPSLVGPKVRPVSPGLSVPRSSSLKSDPGDRGQGGLRRIAHRRCQVGSFAACARSSAAFSGAPFAWPVPAPLIPEAKAADNAIRSKKPMKPESPQEPTCIAPQGSDGGITLTAHTPDIPGTTQPAAETGEAEPVDQESGPVGPRGGRRAGADDPRRRA